jgi:hypothetical protein
MSTTTKTLSQITEELWGFLRILDASGGLPALEDVEIKRSRRDAGWRVKAYTGGHSDTRSAAEAVAAVRAYAELQDAPVEITEPYYSSAQPSGRQVAVKTEVVLGGIPVEVLALLDGAAYAEAVRPALVPAPDVHMAVGFTRDPGRRNAACETDDPFAEVTARMADVTCPACMTAVDADAGPVHVTGPVAEIMAAFPGISEHEAETRFRRAAATNGEH